MLIEILCWVLLGLFIFLLDDEAKRHDERDDLDYLIKKWDAEAKRLKNHKKWWEVW